MRFRAKRLYRMIDRMVGGRGREAGYHDQAHGVVWHEHFTADSLRGLLEPLFDITLLHFRGALLAPLCNAMLFPFYRRQCADHWLAKCIRRLEQMDSSINYGPVLGYNVLLIARKRATTGKGDRAIDGNDAVAS